MHLLCPHHFISTCYERIEEYSPRFREQPFPEEIYTFLTECTPQIARLVENASDLDSLEQARLLHIVLTSYDLSRHLRRSPRRKASILVCLHGEKFGQTWKEKTATRVLSRYGALVECQHPVEAGDTLRVERLDNGKQTQARVAWRQQKWPGRLEIGLEFLNCDNFWELDWSTIHATVGEQNLT